MTVWWKFIFPAVWICGFGAGTAALWLGEFHGRGDQPPPDWMRWQFLVMWLAASTFLIWFARRLHRVSLHGNILTASNYLHEISFPVSSIIRVSQSYMLNPPIITIDLDQDTPLGRRIVFVPAGRRRYFSEHPTTTELKELSARTHKDSRSNF